jgi:hypothetical protein
MRLLGLQVAVLLSEPKRDFTGGDLVMTEQRPRMQSLPMVVAPRQGDAAVFSVHERPVPGDSAVKHGQGRWTLLVWRPKRGLQHWLPRPRQSVRGQRQRLPRCHRCRAGLLEAFRR